jgi:hypothetical protein
LNVSTATLLGFDRLKLPYAIRPGYGPLPPDGVDIDTENDIDFPPSEACTVKLLPENVPVTVPGFPGFVPSSNCSNNACVSA